MYQIGYRINDKKCQFPILAKAGIEVKAVEQLWESNIFYPYTCTFSYSFQIQRLISSSKSPECLAYFWAGEENLLKSLMLYCITLQLIHLQPNQSELWNQVGLVSKVNERKPAAFGRFESLSNNASAKGITSHKRQKKRKVFKGHSDNFHLLSLFSSYFSFTRQSKALWKLKKKSVRRHTPKVVPTQTSVEASFPFLTQLFFPIQIWKNLAAQSFTLVISFPIKHCFILLLSAFYHFPWLSWFWFCRRRAPLWKL